MNKEIQIFDDLIDLKTRTVTYQFVKNSLFKIGWEDSKTEENIRYSFLHSVYDDNDCANLPVYDKIINSEAGKLVHGLTRKIAMVNLSTPADVNFVHAHQEKIGILYYVNLEWRDGWHGETLFYDEAIKKINFASPYTPGRIIVFDPSIPHTIRPQSYLASHYRFTFSMFFS
jgi:hypothetical protein